MEMHTYMLLCAPLTWFLVLFVFVHHRLSAF